ncbi:MAG: MoaD/ThiS family protein [Chloroflexota bacterium]
MELNVRYLLELRDISGIREEKLLIRNDSTVQDLLEQLFERYPAIQTAVVDRRGSPPVPRVRILVNGRDTKFLRGMQTPLAQGDLVSVQPATR